tara:strand:+ start:1427 stop:1657 length:231 start_codon:yes stop_codon:yes gene_type:complete
MNQMKFRLSFVDSNIDDFDKYTATYQDIQTAQYNCTDSDKLEDLLAMLVSGLNNGNFSDLDWYFVCSIETETVLMS